MAGDARSAHEKGFAGVREHQGRDGRQRGTLGAARGKVTTRRGSRQGHSRRGGRHDVSRRSRDGGGICRNHSMIIACYTLLGSGKRRGRAQWLESWQQGRRTLHACHSSRATPRGRRLHDAKGTAAPSTRHADLGEMQSSRGDRDVQLKAASRSNRGRGVYFYGRVESHAR